MTQATEMIRPNLRTVLVVDDQADVREALRLMLKSAGYGIQMADSPEAAITTAAACEPDLVLIDMNYACDTTSGQEGLALLDRLRTLRPNVPVIAMTGWSTIELAVQAMQHGACDFITKPWDVRHLLEMFEKHLVAEHTSRENGSAHSTDLALARRIQRRLLPPQSFAADGLQFHCAFLPFGDVGGDLYDFFRIDPGRVGFLLGDVCGKGLGAALLVATLQATIRTQLELARNLSMLLARVNQQFFQVTRPEHFATLFFGIYEANSRRIRYVNCGHPSPVLLQRDGSFDLLEPNGMVLGAFEKSQFEEQTIDFKPGSRLVLFSDGFSEAGVSSDDDEWTLGAIHTLACEHAETFAGALAAAAVSRGEQTDDITV
ncbi:MAG: SpoIIE family protein phosphatase, partial [Acidobacteriaceae bacterium]|nr:SpoIIE family protein phosphatase [Acidobacteriaceae bacterium]